MAKRRDFIKKSVIGLTAGITAGDLCFGTNPCSSGPSGGGQTQKDWQTDPEWRRIKYGDWGGPGVSAQPDTMDTILLKNLPPSLTASGMTLKQAWQAPMHLFQKTMNKNSTCKNMVPQNWVSWSEIGPLSEWSVKNRATIEVPDFSRGAWKNNKPLDVKLERGGNTQVKV